MEDCTLPEIKPSQPTSTRNGKKICKSTNATKNIPKNEITKSKSRTKKQTTTPNTRKRGVNNFNKQMSNLKSSVKKLSNIKDHMAKSVTSRS